MRDVVFKGKLSRFDAIIEKDEYGAYSLKTPQKEDYHGEGEIIDGQVILPDNISAGFEIKYDFETKEDLKEQLIKEGYAEKEIDEFLKSWNG